MTLAISCVTYIYLIIVFILVIPLRIESANSSTNNEARLNLLDVKTNLVEAAASMKSLQINVFKAMKSICKFFGKYCQVAAFDNSLLMYISSLFHITDGRAVLMFITLYGVSVFSLSLSQILSTADIGSTLFSEVLEIMIGVLHAIFILCSFAM